MESPLLSRLACLLLACSSITPSLRAETENNKDQKVVALLGEAQSLQGRKRYVDALAKLDEAEVAAPERPEVYNMRGAIYLAAPVRDLDKAREQFTKARTLKPDEMPPYFNLAEVEFVGGKWPECEKGFAEILTKFPKLPASVRHLILFKVLVAQVKQNKFEDAGKLLADSFTFMDDTPAYYFSKAVIAFQKKDEKSANDWLAKGQIIFKGNASSAYVDSMMESHYVDSLSVGKAEEPAEPAKP